jgi:hypothetical protein
MRRIEAFTPPDLHLPHRLARRLSLFVPDCFTAQQTPARREARSYDLISQLDIVHFAVVVSTLGIAA